MANNKDILLVVRAETADADQKLATLNKKIGEMKEASGGASPSITELSGNLGTAGEASAELGFGLSAATGLISAGLTIALIAVVPLLIDFGKEMFSASEETKILSDNIDKAIDKLIEFEDPLKNLKFGVDLDKLPEKIKSVTKAIEDYKKEAEQIGGAPVGRGQAFNSWLVNIFGSGISEDEKKRLNQMNVVIEKLEAQKVLWQGELETRSILKELGLDEVDTSKKKTEELKRQKEIIEDIIAITGMDASNIQSISMQVDTSGRNRGGTGKTKGGKDKADMTNNMRDDIKMFGDLMSVTVATMRGEFHSLWEDVFGEANSFVEKLGENIAAMFLELASKQLVLGLFGFISGLFTGGASTAIQAIASSAPTVINVNMGNETLARAVVKGGYEAKRLRLSN